MDVRRVEARRGADPRVHGGAEGEVPTNAEAHDAYGAGALRVVPEELHGGLAVAVVGVDFLGDLELVAAVYALFPHVGEGGACVRR